MSMEPIRITCGKCEFESSDSVTWGSFSYILPNGKEMGAGRALGWCYTCKTFAPIESFPLLADINKKIEELEKDVNSYSFLKKLFNKDKIEWLHKELDEQLAERLFLEERKDPPKCLKCGSFEIESVKIESDSRIITEDDPLRETDFDLSNVPNYWLTFKHPVCGGTLKAELCGFGLHCKFEPRYYDGQGNKI